jgi:hypothetical protein
MSHVEWRINRPPLEQGAKEAETSGKRQFLVEAKRELRRRTTQGR